MLEFFSDRAEAVSIKQNMAHRPGAIEQVEMFDGLSPDDLKMILGVSSRREVPRGSFVYHQGEPARTMFLIEAGRVRLQEITEDGRAVLIRLIYPGEVFG